MSIAFRIFLLSLLVFAGVALYRWRGPVLERIGSAVTGEGRVSSGRDTGLGVDPGEGRARPPRLFDTPPALPWRDGRFAPSEPGEDEGFYEDERFDGEGGGVDAGGGLADGAEELDPDLIAPEDVQGVDAPTIHEEIVYVVEEGDRLWTIAERLLGSGLRWPEIRDANVAVLGGKETVIPGMELRIRVARVREETLKSEPPVDEESVEAGSALERDPPLPRTHKVGLGENLTKIARRYYPGDPRGAQRLFEANRDQLSSPDTVREGQEISIPKRAGH